MECPKCKGSRKCPTCHGKGKVEWSSRAGGMPMITDCAPGSSKYVECRDCHGTGDCPRCNGVGEVDW